MFDWKIKLQNKKIMLGKIGTTFLLAPTLMHCIMFSNSSPERNHEQWGRSKENKSRWLFSTMKKF